MYDGQQSIDWWPMSDGIDQLMKMKLLTRVTEWWREWGN